LARTVGRINDLREIRQKPFTARGVEEHVRPRNRKVRTVVVAAVAHDVETEQVAAADGILVHPAIKIITK
jgi:hypothetical protein